MSGEVGLVIAAAVLATANAAMCDVQPLSLHPDKTVIVAPNHAAMPTRLAMYTLQKWLCRASGVDKGFAVIQNADFTPEPDQIVLALGNSQWSADVDLTGMADHAFVLRRRDSVIVMTGPSEHSALMAAVEFLDRCAGVRFYMPTDLFTVVQPAKTVVVNELDVTSQPFITSSFFSGINVDDKPAYEWVLRTGAWRRLGGTHQHNMFEIFPPGKFAERFPEIYPIYEGARYLPAGPRDQTWQINFLELRAVDAAMESIGEHFKRNPTHQYVACSMNDGGRFDDGPATREFVAKFIEGKTGPALEARAHSAIYWQFMAKVGDRMAVEFPGKRLVGLAYGPSRFPPATRLPDNVTAFTNFHIAELPIDGILDPKGDQAPLLDQWMNVVSHMGNHDWYQGSGYIMPRIYTGYWKRFLKAMRDRLDGAYIHVECYPNWGLDGPKYYILSRMLWNPDVDANAMLARMCSELFGPAGDAMLRYFTTAERLWMQLNIADGPERKLMAWGSQFRTTPESMAMIDACALALDDAAARAATDDQKQRVALFFDSFAVSRALFAMIAAGQPDDDLYQKTMQLASSLTARHQLVAQHPQRFAEATKAVHWEMIKRATRPLTVPTIPAPAIDGNPDDPAWSKAAKDQPFIQKGGGEDEQATRLWIGADDQNLYLTVICPRVHQRELIETPDDHWRSDNVEVFFDLDDDPLTMERQMWVKTTGRVVNWSGRQDATPTDLRGAVRKHDDRYVVQIAIPLSYAGLDASGKSVNIRVVRNEFTPRGGMNVDTYGAIWARKLKLEKR